MSTVVDSNSIFEEYEPAMWVECTVVRHANRRLNERPDPIGHAGRPSRRGRRPSGAARSLTPRIRRSAFRPRQ